MPSILQSKPLVETILFNQDGVNIIANIDYKKEVVSFVDSSGEPFKYVFANRGIEYLGGWIKIFAALEAVTLECNKRLRNYKKNEDEKFLFEALKFSEIIEKHHAQE